LFAHKKDGPPLRPAFVYQTTNTTAMNRAAKLVHKRQAQRQHGHRAQRHRRPTNPVRGDIVASRQRNDSANRSFRRPTPKVAFGFERFRNIEPAQQIKDFHLRLSGINALIKRANADEILLSFVDGVRFAITSKKTIAAGTIAAQFAKRNSIAFQFIGW
jgi:hypothetical protein